MYKAAITRLHPSAFIVLIDRSGSMSERIEFAGEEMPKSRAVALAANSFIDELIHRARRAQGVYDYYDIALLGYSGDGVEPLLTPDGGFVKPSRLAASNVRREKLARERRMPDGRTLLAVTEQNMWIEPKAVGVTPMRKAFHETLALLENWCGRRQNFKSYPPTVLNITDGEASDGNEEDIRAVAARIRETGTADGSTLLLNIHLGRTDNDRPVHFPSSVTELPPQRYARLLFDISSPMPESYGGVIGAMKHASEGPFRGMGYNCPLGDVVAMMNIGSVNSIML